MQRAEDGKEQKFQEQFHREIRVAMPLECRRATADVLS